uniref:Nucleotid_trans domain-containing protein n=1 Tax=Macrostomum lignano TaxID=282301 RepID=A0A1I8FDK5_9PLAT
YCLSFIAVSARRRRCLSPAQTGGEQSTSWRDLPGRPAGGFIRRGPELPGKGRAVKWAHRGAPLPSSSVVWRRTVMRNITMGLDWEITMVLPTLQHFHRARCNIILWFYFVLAAMLTQPAYCSGLEDSTHPKQVPVSQIADQRLRMPRNRIKTRLGWSGSNLSSSALTGCFSVDDPPELRPHCHLAKLCANIFCDFVRKMERSGGRQRSVEATTEGRRGPASESESKLKVKAGKKKRRTSRRSCSDRAPPAVDIAPLPLPAPRLGLLSSALIAAAAAGCCYSCTRSAGAGSTSPGREPAWLQLTGDPQIDARIRQLAAASRPRRLNLSSRCDGRIPLLLHQIYTSDSVPELYRHSIASCIRRHPDFVYVLWTDTEARRFVAANYPAYLAMFDGYKNTLQRSDALRYFILYHFGVYIDMDVHCLQPFDTLVATEACFFDQERPEQTQILHGTEYSVMNSVIGCVKKHPFLAKVIQNLPRKK